MEHKANILLIGGGALGAMAALNMETGSKAVVTAVLRSNFAVVNKEGYEFKSCDHGDIPSWRPTTGELQPLTYCKIGADIMRN